MSTLAQVRAMAKPILQAHPEISLVRRYLIIKPVSHILRFVCIDQSLGKDSFSVSWSVMPMFKYDAFINFRWADRLYDKAFGSWIATKPDVDKALFALVEDEALPILRSVDSIDGFAAFACKENFRGDHLGLHPALKIYVDVARGDRAASLAHCAYFATDLARRSHASLMQDDLDVIQQRLCPMILADDVAGLAAFLHEMEDIAVKRHKLEHLWERTPFPLEECGWI